MLVLVLGGRQMKLSEEKGETNRNCQFIRIVFVSAEGPTVPAKWEPSCERQD